MSAQSIDHLAVLPAYLAGATVVAVLLADLFNGRRGAVLGTAATGFAATALAAGVLGTLPARRTFCTADGCSYITSRPGALIAVVLCALTLAVLALSARQLYPAPRLDAAGGGPAKAPVGEYAFLLASSLTGGIVLAYGRDLITIVVALETLTLPLYVLVALRYRARAAGCPTGGRSDMDKRSAEAAVNFLLVSVAASTVTLFGAALLYAVTGQVHLSAIAATLERADTVGLTVAAVAMIVVGIGFKVAAVPLHAWAPGTYDGAPLPIAAYLSTASKLGGATALLWVLTQGLAPVLDLAGPVLVVLAVASMTVGNLVALRQTRTVRLLAWSSIAQAGYLLVPLAGFIAAGGRDSAHVAQAATAVLGFAVFYVLLEAAAFAAVIGLRGRAVDGGELSELAGAARRGSGWQAGVLILALVGLAGLPPGLAGLFAKITVVSAVAGPAPWLAVIVAGNAVIGLVYYLRFAILLVRAPEPDRAATPRPGWPVAVTVAATAAVAVIVGFAPQLVLGLATFPQ